MTDEAINKKLAEWAGFRYDEDGEFVNGMWANLSGWSRPGEKVRFPEVPEFTDSLDLCFQYLEPKLADYSLMRMSVEWHCASVLLHLDGPDGFAKAETPARAFALAVLDVLEAK